MLFQPPMNHIRSRTFQSRILLFAILFLLLFNQEVGAQINQRYKVITAPLTWDEARKDAESKGGHLASITSPSEWSEVSSIIKSSGLFAVWLGGYKSQDAVEPIY